MPPRHKDFLNTFFRLALSLLTTICLVRVFEYFSVASKFFLESAYKFELAGLFYDVWLCFIYSFILFLLFFALSFLSTRLATVVAHLLNVILLVSYIALIVVLSERNTPFDHEFFTRSLSESITTTKQMMSGGIKVFIPLFAYIALYFLLYYKLLKKVTVSRPAAATVGLLAILSAVFVKYSNPSQSWFKQTAAYYLASNKMTYWFQDSYEYFATKNQREHKLNNAELEKEIEFYQQNQPFDFTSKEYPLLHTNNDNDVLGSFFNFKQTPPNIVILVVEGLSRDFSGDNAYASSFTPFLDSLSKSSLVWDNFLSTAPGTFAAHPAISGSLPYGKRGFSIMNVMPDHLSLIKILKQNGYYTNFMIGFNPDFDNMGGYIRLQGTDYILTNYPSKYKQMGIGDEGWSMGYPDDALFPRSLAVLDSIHQSPYLSIYHTATSHMPYLFEQKPQYERLFDKKLKTLSVSNDIRRTLGETKTVLTTFMFADDCIKKFFVDYSKRPEFSNTIFFITGDHHIGSFPSTGSIDDYHVPFIVYSPMLKHPQKFLSVNSHNNITPTILALLSKNFHLPNEPKQVHWLGDVMDTAIAFRNIHSMPFMAWSREISDYIYKEYFVSGNQLYRLTPNLLEEEYENDSIKSKLIKLRENFKIINNYVCDSNKVYPLKQNLLPGDKQLLYAYKDLPDKQIYSKSPDTTLMKDFSIPKGYKYLYVEVSAKVNLPSPNVDYHPALNFSLFDATINHWRLLYETQREFVTLTKGDFVPRQWNNITTNDLFELDDYKKIKDLHFSLIVYTDSIPINLRMQDLDVKFYGIK